MPDDLIDWRVTVQWQAPGGRSGGMVDMGEVRVFADRVEAENFALVRRRGIPAEGCTDFVVEDPVMYRNGRRTQPRMHRPGEPPPQQAVIDFAELRRTAKVADEQPF